MLQPEDDSWAAVVYDSAGEAADQLGTAVVIDRSRLLTCSHVIASDLAREQVWVGFPKAMGFMHRGRWPAAVTRADSDLDVAVATGRQPAAGGGRAAVAVPTAVRVAGQALVDFRVRGFAAR